MAENKSKHKKSKYLLIRIIFIILGSVFVSIGAIGVLVPGLPTTPFMILAAACYIRSSDKLYNWLINNRVFGKHIKNIREGKGIPIKIKFFALSMKVIFLTLAIIPVSPIYVPSVLLRVIIIFAGVLSFWYVSYKIPTLKK